jgi:excisionase family DNA binding protein
MQRLSTEVRNMADSKANSDRRLLAVDDVAAMLGVSGRHVYRLADAGKMPRPFKLGGAVRWDRLAIADWIAAGCPETPNAKGGRQ